MKILTAAEMGAVDRRTAEEFGVSLEALMEAAGGAVAAFCLRRFGMAQRVTVLCGRGNNGGDGFVTARVLAGAGRVVRVVLLGRIDEVKGEAGAALRRLREEAASVTVDEVVDEVGLKEVGERLGDVELLIDAVVGTGFKPPLRGLAAGLREMVAAITVTVVAVDVPSGWDADSMEQRVEGAFRADAVVTFTAPKIAHVFGHLTFNEETGGTFGPVVVAGIGSPDA
ncbi:MAG TPA: NAD(P)H-hydrate epimerase, partial [Edaphobacter sp.]|nr:NAD(P)H-hydrate epimerase [Edaphobacter sp.]